METMTTTEMELPAHTPGPWFVQSDTDIVTEDGDFIATSVQPDAGIAFGVDYANAALIAQAPALLAERDRLRADNERLRAALQQAVDYVVRVKAHQGIMTADELAAAEKEVRKSIGSLGAGRWVGDTIYFDLRAAQQLLEPQA